MLDDVTVVTGASKAGWSGLQAHAYFIDMSAASVPESPLLSLLHRVPLFAELHDDALLQLARRCVTRTVATGNVLFTTGEECRGLYMIESGRVRIYRTDPAGRDMFVVRAGVENRCWLL